MATYKITSVKGTTEIEGTLAEAIAAARAHEEEFQPAFGVEIILDGETVAEVRDGEVEYRDAA